MADIAATVAAAFADRCAQRGLTPDPSLRLVAHAGAVPAPPVGDGSLGQLHERLVSATERTRRGAWYTPRWLADDLVRRAVGRPVAVADPACGGGVFLLAAAERLHGLGVDPATVVARHLWGADIDPLAVAVAEAELWLWSADHGVPTVAGAQLRVGDPLDDLAIPSVGAVVGNPPFLGQLKSTTSHDERRRRALVERWGRAVRPYTDASWLFLLAAVEAVEPDGRVALVMPQSLLAARDATSIRDRIDGLAELVDCWIDDGRAFEAAVDVCAPVLERTHGLPSRSENDWRAAIGRAHRVPVVELAGTDTLGSLCTVVAGFRDEYYGLVGAVREGGPGPRLVTSGAIDPLRTLDVPVRFAKRRWTDPTVDVAAATGRAVRWLAAQATPKLIVASQTRVLEATVDADASMVAGVPAIVVVPTDPADLWHLAAAVHAPSVSAWMLRQTIGTGLSADSCRPTATLVAAIPLPTDRTAWDAAADIAEKIASGTAGPGAWDEFAVAADAAHGIDAPDLRAWWRDRLPLRSPAHRPEKHTTS